MVTWKGACLQHGGLQLVHKLEALHHHALCQFHQQLQQIRDACVHHNRSFTHLEVGSRHCRQSATVIFRMELVNRVKLARTRNDICVHA